jgi:hypothetical protein
MISNNSINGTIDEGKQTLSLSLSHTDIQHQHHAYMKWGKRIDSLRTCVFRTSNIETSNTSFVFDD